MNNTQIEKIKEKFYRMYELHGGWLEDKKGQVTPVEVWDFFEKEIQENYVSKEESNKNMEDLCEMIMDTDQTTVYRYGNKGKHILNNKGELAGTGKRWKTPYEIAQDRIRMLNKSKTQEGSKE